MRASTSDAPAPKAIAAGVPLHRASQAEAPQRDRRQEGLHGESQDLARRYRRARSSGSAAGPFPYAAAAPLLNR